MKFAELRRAKKFLGISEDLTSKDGLFSYVCHEGTLVFADVGGLSESLFFYEF